MKINQGLFESLFQIKTSTEKSIIRRSGSSSRLFTLHDVEAPIMKRPEAMSTMRLTSCRALFGLRARARTSAERRSKSAFLQRTGAAHRTAGCKPGRGRGPSRRRREAASHGLIPSPSAPKISAPRHRSGRAFREDGRQARSDSPSPSNDAAKGGRMISMDERRHSGGCLCGRVRFCVTGTPYRVGICHCLDCRKHHGALFHASAIFPRTAATIDGEPRASRNDISAPTAAPLSSPSAATRSKSIWARSMRPTSSRPPTNSGPSAASAFCRLSRA